ncbi:hypothetical protein NGA_0435500, partial [Nannochloropsis gaditana CCMP526]|uniref:uncharacterized protein n=1 Tax=Nannochloropsis gaditana (strain CCMP526) TaxID=1093141 RepID=UPI00029F4FA6
MRPKPPTSSGTSTLSSQPSPAGLPPPVIAPEENSSLHMGHRAPPSLPLHEASSCSGSNAISRGRLKAFNETNLLREKEVQPGAASSSRPSPFPSSSSSSSSSSSFIFSSSSSTSSPERGGSLDHPQ